MADRTSASVFAIIFELLADIQEGEEVNSKKMAEDIYEMTAQYDFNTYQMGCDEALLVLGLAEMGIHPDEPDEPERILYKNDW